MKMIFFLAAFIPVAVHAQQGQITIVQDSSIQRVLNLYQTFAKEKRQVTGYRIQLASNNSRQELLNIKGRFIQEFPDYTAYIEYSAPQFKLRVGDFKTRNEADRVLEDIRIEFSSAFIVPDKIVIEGVGW
jgi:hypothetical protein